MRRNSSADRPKRRSASWSSACRTSSRAQAASQPLLPSGTPRCSWIQPISGDSGVRRSPVTHPAHRTFTLCLARSADELRPRTKSVLPPARPESAAHQSASSPHSPQQPHLKSYSDRTLPDQSPQPRHPNARTSPTPQSPPALPPLPATHALIALQASPSSPPPAIPDPGSPPPRHPGVFSRDPAPRSTSAHPATPDSHHRKRLTPPNPLALHPDQPLPTPYSASHCSLLSTHSSPLDLPHIPPVHPPPSHPALPPSPCGCVDRRHHGHPFGDMVDTLGSHEGMSRCRSRIDR